MTGVIVDGETGEPVAGAFVLLQSTPPRVAESDPDGRFVLSGMSAGTYPLQVRHLGYRTVEHPLEVAGEADMTRVTVELHRQTVAVAPIIVEVERRSVTGPLAGVYERVDQMRRLGQGRFFGREEMERWGVNRVSDVLGTVPGVLLLPGQIILNRLCGRPPLYYLDGMPLRMEAGDHLDRWVHPSQVEIVEVYRRASEVPGEYGGSSAQCGVIAVWTRRGP